MLQKFKSISFRIILYTSICVAVTSIISNTYLYIKLNHVINEKVNAIDELYLQTIKQQLDLRLSHCIDLAVLCSNDLDIAKAMTNQQISTIYQKQACIRAQEVLNTYLRSSDISQYINKLMVFNESDVFIQANTIHYGSISDCASVRSTPLFQNSNTSFGKFHYALSITPHKPDCLVLLYPVYNLSSILENTYLYIEVSTDLVSDVLKPYTPINTIFVSAGKNAAIGNQDRFGNEIRLSGVANGDTFSIGDELYKLSLLPLEEDGLYINNCINITNLSVGKRRTAYTLYAVLLSMLCVSMGVLVIMGRYVTKPINYLIAHIKKLSNNQFLVDPKIEEGQDEIGEVGKVVNEMTLSIIHLLAETKEMYEQRKNIEISFLQSQVNPHFLYNTLDSIHWMAVIQKNPGICSITKSLTSLLRNLAKGTQDRIPLREEIKLLEDYVAIQSIRYIETFEFINQVPESYLDYKIIKLTLQPLVENAIFHGIEPTGEFGTITLSAAADGEDLILTVEDNGVGIEREKLDSLLSTSAADSRNSLNGIGLANVDTRLKLIYGKGYGLGIESNYGEFTKVSVRIPMEKQHLRKD